MGSIHRAINLIVALTLVALGCGGVVYFYFIATTWNRGLAIAAGIVALAGLYWLWDEHVNASPRSGER
jgi:protein-S-isoprenylcysteine O-methyltransferase Ste14